MEIMEAIMNIMSPIPLLMIFLGVVMGLIFGVVPGLNTPIAMALVLPFTFSMGNIPTICLIMGIYMGGVSGGLVTAIMLKIPGTAASVATTFDGYPMALKGEGLKALQIGTLSSFFGGIFSGIALITLTPLLSKVALGFGPWEYFGSSILALSLVCVLVDGELLKGFISTGLGLFATTVGMSPIDGIATRFTFGNFHLENGFSLIAIVIGIFALPEVINNAGNLLTTIKPMAIEKRRFYILPIKEIKKYLGTWTRSSILGTIVGILPGLGGGPAAMIAYAQEKRLSKTPEKFGKGTGYGVAAAESANNATTGGALIPTLALGIPGDTTTAIMLGAFSIQGIVTGPLLSINHPVMFRTILFTVIIANIFMFAVQAGSIRYMAKIITIPRAYLVPLITLFCVAGVYTLNNNIFDVYYMLGFALLGYILSKNKYPIAPFILAAVLGGIVEGSLRRALSYYGTFSGCMQQPSIGTIFFVIAVLVPVVSILSTIIRQNKAKK